AAAKEGTKSKAAACPVLPLNAKEGAKGKAAAPPPPAGKPRWPQQPSVPPPPTEPEPASADPTPLVEPAAAEATGGLIQAPTARRPSSDALLGQ
nr:hypothetical protein [Deltaproteobacteria bacterium]